MKNKKLLFFFSFVLIFVIAFTGWWFINFYFAKDFHQKIQQRLSNQDITFSIRKHVITGYPFYVENIFYNVNLLLPKDSNKTFAVSSLYVEKLVIVYPVWNPDDLSFSISGSSKFTLKGGSKTFLTNQDSLEGKIVFNKMKEANLFLKKFQLAIENEKKLLFIEEFRLSVNQFFLNKKSDTIAEQSYSERQLFEKAYERLKSELEVVLSEKAQKKMDKALKRNENLEQKEIQMV